MRTIVTTKNFSTAILSRRDGKSAVIKFRNGYAFNLTWSQFVLLRDNYKIMSEFSIEQLGDDFFRIKNNKLDYRGTARDISFILRVKSECDIEQIGEETFRIKNDRFELVGSFVTNGLFFLVDEFLNGNYECPCRNKVVLDVGGFQGETAVFFSIMGAKKVIVYEPVVSHFEFMKQNIMRNKVNAEIHNEGVGEENGTKVVKYEKTDVGFGVTDIGSKRMEIAVRNVSEVLDFGGAQIAKFDCEGGEKSLLKVPMSVLRKLELYMIEVHSTDVKKALIEKFTNSGFNLTKNTKGDPCSVVYFKRRDNKTSC